MITTFQIVAVTGQRSGKCLCGKRVTQSKKFEQTINPWNKNAEGKPKTYAEILTEIQRERSIWMGQPPRHQQTTYPQWSRGQKESYNAYEPTMVPLSCGELVEIVRIKP